MTFWYNAPKDGSKFAELNCSDYANTDANFVFEEFKIAVTDDAYIFYGLATKATDVKKAKTDSFELKNELIAVTVHRKNYTKRKQVDGVWKDVPVTLTRAEQATCKVIEYLGLNFDLTYKGSLNLGLSLNDERVMLDGVKANGQPVSPELMQDTVMGILYLEEREAVALKDISYSANKKGSYSGGGSKGQTEAERLNERWEFTKKILSPYSDDCNNLGDLAIAATLLDALNGYDRQTDTVMVSAGGGINLTFKVFGLKVVSTIHNFLGDVQFEELARRCMVVKFKNVDQLGLDKPFYPQPLDAFDLSIFRSKFNEFWFKEENLVAYSKTRSKIRRRGRKGSLPTGFTATRWTISVDLICSGCVLDLWDIESGLQALGDYWQWFDGEGKPELSPLQQLLKQLIDAELRAIEAINKKYGDGTADVEVSAKNVKGAVSYAASVGQLDSNPNAAAIADTMRSLGWVLKMNPAKKLSWQQIN